MQSQTFAAAQDWQSFFDAFPFDGYRFEVKDKAVAGTAVNIREDILQLPGNNRWDGKSL